MAQSSLGYNLPTLLPFREPGATQCLPAGGTFPLHRSAHNRSYLLQSRWLDGRGNVTKQKSGTLQGAANPASGWYYIQSAFQCCVALSTSVGLSESHCFGCKMELTQRRGLWLFLAHY